MTENHPSPEAIELFILGHLSTLEMRDVARHLLSGCPECQQATSRLWEPEDVFEEPELVLGAAFSEEDEEEDAADGYDEVLDRVFGKVAATEAIVVEQRKAADKLFEELRQYPAARQHLLLSNSQRFRDRMLCERLIEESHEAGFEEPCLAIDLARHAASLADRLTVEECGGQELHDGLRARAWAQLANAFRVNADLVSAEENAAVAEALLSDGRLTLLDRARVLALVATLRRDQKRLAEALQLFDRTATIYRKLGQWGLLGRTLLQKGLVFAEVGDIESEMKLLRQALDLIDPEAEPRVFLTARHNLIHALHDSGRSREAFALLFHTRPLYLKMGDRLSLLRLRWLEGLVAFGLNRLEQAEVAFREIREGFIELGLSYEVALAALDLAGVYIARGRSAEVLGLAEETLAIFQAHNRHQGALAALLVFSSAARMDQAGMGLVKEVSSFLKRARNNPDLHFTFTA
jgi:tetratricopeptide (TPR) repeat protein